MLDRLPGSQRLWLASPHLGAPGRRLPRVARRADPVPPRAGRVAARRVPADLRHRAGQRGDAERGAAVHRGAGARSRPARHHDRDDPAARRRVVARGARDAVPGALPGARRDRRAPERACTRAGGRVIAVGTTVVRALETVDRRRRAPCTRDRVGPSSWSRPSAGVRAVDGLVTGWHEPEASHLLMLEAIAGRPALETRVPRRTTRWVPVARVRRQPPAAPGARGTMSPVENARVAPPLPEGRRAVLYALRRRGQATAEDIAAQPRHDRERRAPAPQRARRRRAGRGDRGAARPRASGAARSSSTR